MITILGIINVASSGLVVFFFCVKKAPLLLEDIWKEWWYTKDKLLIEIFKLIITILKSIQLISTDFDLLFQLFYICVSILGLLIHPFLFGLLTFDFLRLK